ncbi:hypothetical protein LTR16_001153 [Cryomyces antarcticus]|uniref:PHD-type domain-containing protein n=1 Tax=Cryomyces antarcticus TaxID=329879 RepID=A0ABR0LQF1_9PEZI|nr:hypothetical protein LTR16_001153 [Cryomyces antarcticus]
MPARKRGRLEMETEDLKEEVFHEPSILDRLRNMWEFASLMQYIFLFGKAVKIDEDFDIEVLANSPRLTSMFTVTKAIVCGMRLMMLFMLQELEVECLRHMSSEKLPQLGLALLKYVSSHKGLTPEIFDEYARRQYVAKAPNRNPFGEEEVPNKFNEFDVFTKIRVLHQLSTWTLGNPERIREKMAEKDAEQTQWRMEPLGWDSDERSLFVLDDDRLYRKTDAPLPAPPPKSKAKPKTKKGRKGRTSKRRKISATGSERDDEEEEAQAAATVEESPVEDDGFGGATWECLAVTLEEYNTFLESMRRSRDPNEKALHKRITVDVLPIIEKKAEAQRQKVARKQRELENMQKLATAKRSSRIADKMGKQKEIEEAAEAERKRITDLAMARKEQERQKNMEQVSNCMATLHALPNAKKCQARESRMMTREQRLKEREMKRILHEEELKKLEESSKNIDAADSRLSERHLKAEMEKRQKELQQLAQEDEWVFDCSICGVHGENLDDGSHSIACEKCNVWQHSACHGFKKEEAERDDFHFLCADCRRRDADAKKPKIPPLRFGPRPSSSPKTETSSQLNTASSDRALPDGSNGLFASRSLNQNVCAPAYRPSTAEGNSARPRSGVMNGPSLSPEGQRPGPPGLHKLNGMSSPGVPQPVWHGSPLAPPRLQSFESRNGHLVANGLATSPPAQHMTAHANALASANYYGNMNNALPFTNGPRVSSHGQPPPHNPFRNSFDRQQHRPSSSHSANGFPSPVKHQAMHSPSPAETNIAPLTFPLAASPGASFPPASNQQAVYSPVKHPSSPPQPLYTSPRALQGFTNGLSPTKNLSPRPTSSHEIGRTPVMPPVPSLSPNPNPQIMSAPSKKTPERPNVMM